MDTKKLFDWSCNSNPENDTLEQARERGRLEADGSIGYTYDNNPSSPRSAAYDGGRDAERKRLGLDDADEVDQMLIESGV